MKHIKLFEEFVTSQENIDVIVESASNEAKIQLDEFTYSVDEGALKQVIGWTFFPALSLMNVGYQLIRKKAKIKKMLDKESDPKKKEALKKELKTLKYEEVKAKEKIKKKEEELDAKIKAAKAKMTPEEKEKLSKEMAKKKEELAKAKEKFKKEKEQSSGIV